MSRKIKDSEIEKILINFNDSDISDDDDDESRLVENLFDASDSNNSFILEELSQEGKI